MSKRKPQYIITSDLSDIPADATITSAEYLSTDVTEEVRQAQAVRRGRLRRQQAVARARKQRPRTVQPVKRLRRPGMFAYVGRPSAAAYADNLGLRLNLSEGYQEPEPELPKPQKVFVRFYKKS